MRLQRARQLPHTHLARPPATHTRFGNSPGAMHVAGPTCDRLELDPEMARLAGTAALLRNVGHGPFSHLLKSAPGPANRQKGAIHKPTARKTIPGDPETGGTLGRDRHAMAELLSDDKGKAQKKRRPMPDIVPSGLDADRLGCLARVSFCPGVNHGKSGLVRTLRTACPAPEPAGSAPGAPRAWGHVGGLPGGPLAPAAPRAF